MECTPKDIIRDYHSHSRTRTRSLPPHELVHCLHLHASRPYSLRFPLKRPLTRTYLILEMESSHLLGLNIASSYLPLYLHLTQFLEFKFD